MSLKLIVALDFDSREAANALISQLDPAKCALKVGSELFTLLGPEFVSALVAQQFKVFLDLKFHDIPNTVARACQVASDLGVWMLNVHASGGLAMMQSARAALGENPARPLLMAVTVLTSMGEADLASVGVRRTLQEHVKHLACLAKEAGIDGVVCSAHETQLIKAHCGPHFLTVTPGIRLPGATPDDQARITHPSAALRAGSDYLVVGRPITSAPNPQQVVSEILACCHP
jgi:orotidine-5'-phosphate decarboxylase